MTPDEMRRAAVLLRCYAVLIDNEEPRTLARLLREEADSQGWRPIETGPRDGTRVLLWHRYRPRSSAIGYWSASHGDWMSDSGELQRGFISYWRPLPPPPQGREG